MIHSIHSSTRRESKPLAFSDLDLENDGQVVQFVKDRWEDRAQRRQALERQWYLNVAYYLGFQYLEWSDAGNELVLPTAPPWRVRLVANRLQVIVRKQVSKFLRQKPTWLTLPATSEEEDILKAKLSTKALQYYWRLRKMNQQMVDLFTWMGCTGNAFMRPYWDPYLGDEIAGETEALETSDPTFFDRFRKLIGVSNNDGTLSTQMGDLDFEVCSPFEIDPDPDALSLQKASHVIQSTPRTTGWIKDRYGKKVRPTGKSDNLTRHYMARIAGFSGPSSASGYGDSAADDPDTVIEHTLWVNPSKKYRHGRFVVVAGDEVCHRGDLDTPRIPLVHVKEIHVPGRLWGTSALEQCIHLQQEYNRARSQTVENRNQMAKPKWLLPKGSGVMDNALTSEPGEVIEYNWPYEPKQLTPTPLPEYVHQTLEYCLKDIDDVSAQHEVSQAKVPSSVRSGIAIATLQEQDDSMLGPTLGVAEDAMAQVGTMALQLLHKHVTEERLIKIVGRDDEVETVAFKGSDLVGQNTTPGVNYFDVTVQMGSQLPLSKAARLEFIKELAQYKILNPEVPTHQRLLLEMLEIGSEEPIYSESRLDKNAVYRENLQLDAGVLLEINPWDNDEFHLEDHRRRQKKADYLRLVVQNPAVGQNYEQHIAWHVERMQVAAGVVQEAALSGVEPQQEVGEAQPGLTTDDLAGLVAQQQEPNLVA